MNKTIRNLAIVAVFCFIGLPGFPQELEQTNARSDGFSCGRIGDPHLPQ